MKSTEHWLLILADPEPSHPDLPRARLNRREILSLCLSAEWHGVLPAVLNRIEIFLAENPGSLLADAQSAPNISAELEPMRRRIAERSAMAMFLAAETQKLLREISGEGVEVMPLKGMDFAARLYPQPSLRPFVDVDLLIRKKDWGATAKILARLKYTSHEPKMKRASAGYGQQSWENPAMPGAMVELHHDLVNSPSVRRGVSLRLDDLPLERGARSHLQPTPAGLLVIASVHAATGHNFEKLQHLCDIAQIVRGRAGAIDETELRECVEKTGAKFCVAAALDLTARALKNPECAELLARLDYDWPKTLTRWLITPELVIRSLGPRRRSGLWRRRILRQMLKNRR